ncbi:MAG: hypothetical protein CVU14_11260 [Bacteroidetes bacterium HGW-Bacteroidetes-9]|nr:MAG: hypothetical protein CVU14_11260 [Bacteroidetes bacterium HGW-Bacteroidetes-9]
MNHIKTLLLSLLLTLFAFTGKAQPHALLQDFSGFQQDDQLVLRWTFRSGSLCEGTRVERSDDGLIFNQIGEIPGICGNPETAFSYTFIDSFPKHNAINHYRLELGNYGFTSTIAVEFLNTGENGFIVLSSGSGQTDILFQNKPGRKGKAIIYSSVGKRITETEIIGKRISLAPGRFAAGVYLLMLIFDDNTSLSGNFVIAYGSNQ